MVGIVHAITIAIQWLPGEMKFTPTHIRFL